HVENPNSVTTLIQTDEGFHGDRVSTLENVYCNWYAARDLQEEQYYVQAVTPFVFASADHVKIRDPQFSGEGLGDLPLVFASANERPLEIVDNGSFWNPTVWNQSAFPKQWAVNGFGRFSRSPFAPTASVSWSGQSGRGIGWIQEGRGAFPIDGRMPAGGFIPE